MTEVLQTLSVAVLVFAGALVGWAFSRLKSRAWVVGYLLPLVVIVMIVLARRVPRLTLVAPFSWIMAGRVEFLLYGAMGAMLLTTPLSRLKSKQLRQLVVLFLVLATASCSVLPFLQPLLLRAGFSRLETQLDPDGVCLQSTGYTCGPAAAVTALGGLGLEAEEGEIAILSHTSSLAGSPADLLCAALRERYGRKGLRCEYRAFDSVDELRDAGVVMAEINLSLLMDHWVVVFAVTRTSVVLGDPAYGRRTVAREEFKRMWRSTGIVLERPR